MASKQFGTRVKARRPVGQSDSRLVVTFADALMLVRADALLRLTGKLSEWLASPSLASTSDRDQHLAKLPIVIGLLAVLDDDRRSASKEARALLQQPQLSCTDEGREALRAAADRETAAAMFEEYGRLVMAWIQLVSGRPTSHERQHHAHAFAACPFGHSRKVARVDGAGSPTGCSSCRRLPVLPSSRSVRRNRRHVPCSAAFDAFDARLLHLCHQQTREYSDECASSGLRRGGSANARCRRTARRRASRYATCWQTLTARRTSAPRVRKALGLPRSREEPIVGSEPSPMEASPLTKPARAWFGPSCHQR